jgi:hypothetical protein
MWPQNRNPWNASLIYEAPDGRQGGLVSYMTTPATWHTLNALTGATLDVPNRAFYLAPHIPKGMGELHVPLFFPTFWARVDAVPARKRLTVTVTKVFGHTPAFTVLRGDVDAPSIRLAKPLEVKAGSTWDLSAYWSRLVQPAKASVRPERFRESSAPRRKAGQREAVVE